MVGILGAVRSCKQLQVTPLLRHISTMMSDLDRTALCVVGEKIWLPSRDVRSELLIVLHVSLQIPDPPSAGASGVASLREELDAATPGLSEWKQFSLGLGALQQV